MPPQAASHHRVPRVRLADWRLAALVALLLFVPWNGLRTLWFPDEPDVAEPAISMLQTGDWVVPRQNGVPWLDYPPLTYWLGAASGLLLGAPSPFALRLPVALIALLLVAATGAAAQRLAGRAAGWWTGISLATAPHFLYQAVSFHPDMAFATLIAGGLAAYAYGVLAAAGSISLLWRALGFASFGGAVLAKGPLGLLLPGLILVVWHLATRRWRGLLWLGPLSLVAVGVALPWYLALAGATDPDFVWREVYLQNFDRFGEGSRGHHEPSPFYYLLRIWFDWAPWSLLIPPALVAAWREARERPVFGFLLAWLCVPVVFLSLAATKRQVYLLPVYPALALLIGCLLARWTGPAPPRSARWTLAATGAGFVAFGLAPPLVAGLLSLSGSNRPEVVQAFDLISQAPWQLATFFATIAATGLLILHRAVAGDIRRGFAATAAALVLTFLGAQVILSPLVDQTKSYRPAAHWLRARSGDRPIGFYLPGARNKMVGFRVEDPLRIPLEILLTPAQVDAYLTAGSHLVVLDASQVPAVSATLADWSSLPKKELRMTDRRFLAIGPRLPPEAR